MELFINGEWQKTAQLEDLTDTFSGEPYAQICVAQDADVDRAVGWVADGFKTHQLSLFERYEILSAAAGEIAGRRDELCDLMRHEVGFPRSDTDNEVNRCIQTLRLSAEAAKTIVGDMVPLEATPGLRSRLGYTIRVPRGVVCAITPFNSPLNTVAHKVAPALAAGNALVLKPAPQAPLTARILVETLLRAGLPAELIAFVHGSGEVGKALVDDSRIAYYTFTGSTGVGRYIQQNVGLRQTQLELGSIASTIVTDTADLDDAIGKLVPGSFRKAGQVCTSVQKIFVDKKVARAFIDQFVERTRRIAYGDPANDDTVVGPMIDRDAALRVESWVREAVAGGAQLLCGGQREGNVFQPTILTRVGEEMKVCCEEVFGPVVSIFEYDELEAAISRINANEYGLAVGLFTSNLQQALRYAPQLQYGSVHINQTSSSRVDVMPFGGIKNSGHGKEGPHYAIQEMTEERLVTISY